MSEFFITGVGAYRTRDGRRAWVAQISDNGQYPCDGYVYERKVTWDRSGFCFHEGYEDPHDIVAKWTDPEPPKPVQAEQNGFGIRDVGTYIRRDGGLAEVEKCHEGGEHRWSGKAAGMLVWWRDDGRIEYGAPNQFDIVAKWPADGGLSGPIKVEQIKQEAGSKFDAGKTRLDLIAPEFLLQTADVLAFGAKKYGDRNWEAGMSWSRCYAALQRHMIAFWSGQDTDEETGLPHLAHAACCLMFLMAFQSRSGGTDDRAKLL